MELTPVDAINVISAAYPVVCANNIKMPQLIFLASMNNP